MSGDRVVLSDPALEPLGGALAQLVGSGADFALVGGLAVLIRLARSHRATHDVDTTGSAPAMIGRLGPAVRPEGNRLWLDGVKIDVIDLDGHLDDDPADVAAATDDPRQRVFLVAHLWAHQSAEPVDCHVTGHDLTIRVARPDALVGGKVAARLSHTRDPAKQPSDAADLVRLLAVGPPAPGLPPTVARVLADGLSGAVLNRAELVARDANRFDPAARRVTAEEVSVLAEDWIHQLR